jgi:hypothetical protein
VRITGLGPVRSSTPAQRDAWLLHAEQLGRQAR